MGFLVFHFVPTEKGLAPIFFTPFYPVVLHIDKIPRAFSRQTSPITLSLYGRCSSPFIIFVALVICLEFLPNSYTCDPLQQFLCRRVVSKSIHKVIYVLLLHILLPCGTNLCTQWKILSSPIYFASRVPSLSQN